MTKKGDWTSTMKSAAGSWLLRTGLYRALLGDSAVIVAFHRIDDRYRGNAISYPVEGFRRFCAFFKRHFSVVSLPDLLDDLEADRSVAGKVAITFDDGYLDNFTVAAPILSDLGLPATFFLATGFIGSERVAWWDREVGIRSEWMDWDHVIELQKAGFSIGAHTVNHVDLGVVGGNEARMEIESSRSDLEERLGQRVDLFAYPYGRPDQLSEENRALIRELGFRCAPSCYGGRVSPGDDPYRIRRIPISPWYRDEGQFAFEILRMGRDPAAATVYEIVNVTDA